MRADGHVSLRSHVFPFTRSLARSAHRTALPTFSFSNRGVRHSQHSTPKCPDEPSFMGLSVFLPTEAASSSDLKERADKSPLILPHVPSDPHQPPSSGPPLDSTATAPVPTPDSPLTTTTWGPSGPWVSDTTLYHVQSAIVSPSPPTQPSCQKQQQYYFPHTHFSPLPSPPLHLSGKMLVFIKPIHAYSG